jgi:hypothetical protein
MRSGRTQALTINPDLFLIPSSNARRALTNSLGCFSLSFIPLSNARQAPTGDQGLFSPPLITSFVNSALACLMTYGCEQPLDFPDVNIRVLTLSFRKGLQSVGPSHCDLCSSPLPRHLMHSYPKVDMFFSSFLASWLRQCVMQASCIASCHCVGYRSPYHRCIILGLRLRRHSILRHDFLELSIRCLKKISRQRKEDLWQISGSHLRLILNKLKSYKLVYKNTVRLHRRLQNQTVRELDTSASGPAGLGSINSTLVSNKKFSRRVGGGCVSKAFSFSQISDYMVSGSAEGSQDNMFRYVAHVDEIGLLAYPSSNFVHTSVPLSLGSGNSEGRCVIVLGIPWLHVILLMSNSRSLWEQDHCFQHRCGRFLYNRGSFSARFTFCIVVGCSDVVSSGFCWTSWQRRFAPGCIRTILWASLLFFHCPSGFLSIPNQLFSRRTL